MCDLRCPSPFTTSALYTDLHAHIFIHIHIYMCIVCMHEYVHACMHTPMHMHMRTHARAHTHTYTHAHEPTLTAERDTFYTKPPSTHSKPTVVLVIKLGRLQKMRILKTCLCEAADLALPAQSWGRHVVPGIRVPRSRRCDWGPIDLRGRTVLRWHKCETAPCRCVVARRLRER
jgi:hypothetical protein